LAPGDLIRKILIVTFEVSAEDLRQVVYLSRRQADGSYACCYHIGRLSGGVFMPEMADCIRPASADAVDLRLEAVFSGVRTAAEGKFMSHTIYDLSALHRIEEQVDFLAARSLAHMVSALSRP
jgi:hypothetical protein